MTEEIVVTNWLNNGSFEVDRSTDSAISGHSWVLPHYWEVATFSQSDWPYVDKQNQSFTEPEIRVITYLEQFPEEELLHGDGLRILKVFKESAPTFASIVQSSEAPSGLYKLIVPVFPDLWHKHPSLGLVRPDPEHMGNLVSDDWYLGGVFRIYANMSNVMKEVEFDLRQVPIGKYTELELNFKHEGGLLKAGFEFLGRWGYKNNGCFFDNIRLEKEVEDPCVALREQVRSLEIDNEQLKARINDLRETVVMANGILSSALEDR